MNPGRSPRAPLYWLMFAAGVAAVIALNLDFPGRPPQDPGALTRDAWFVLGFSYFGMLIVGVTALMIDDARRRGMRWPVYVVPYFVVGILALSVYLARRPASETADAPTPRILELRWVWWLVAALTAAMFAAFLPAGSPGQLVDTTLKNTGLGFMWLDIALNHVAVLPLAQADMRRRGVARSTAWLAAIAMTGPVGLALYLARRR